MPTIVPRWEWRTFATHFGAVADRFAELTQTGVQDSDEIYFLGGAGAIVKVRDALLDVKVLREVDANGLERWEPVIKQPFPLPAPEVTRLYAALGLTTPPLAREAYTLAQFVDELVAPSGALRPVKVHKHRVRYTVDGCTAELSDVLADGKPCRTIAIEDEDPTAVIGAVTSVGLGGHLNTNYPHGLQRLLDDAPERYAVIDVGTNSVKLHIAERAGSGWRSILDRAELTRLGEGLEASGEISPEAAARTADAICDMVEEANRNGASAILAVGTAGLRLARNSAAVVEVVRSRAGIAIEVISGEEESRLAYRAVEAGLAAAGGSLVVFDTGGGSSQFTFGQDRRVLERFSVNVGAARYTEQFGLGRAVAPEVLREALAAISADLSCLDGRTRPDALVAMGGAVTNLTAVKFALSTYDPDVVQGAVLDRAEIDRQIELYRSCDAAARRAIVGLQPNRAEVILAGACIVGTVMDKLGAGSLTVSDRGLRHGVVVDRFGA
jgi:exopolyphosphatase/guanosine-5'-triphosphate,3'-diphosphate pyrophosphatase